MLEHMESTGEKNASLFLTKKEGGASFSLLTRSVWGGGRGNFLSALKKVSARKGVNNYK